MLDMLDQDHEQVENDTMRAAGRRSTLVSVVVNVLLLSLQLVVGFISHSQALIADGIHSLSDLISDFVVLFAGKFSHDMADEEHPYGHHRFENAASMVLGGILIAVGVGMLFTAFKQIQNPHMTNSIGLAALWVAIIALVCKELLFRYMLKIAEKARSSMLVANAWHARSDAASSLIVAIGIVGSYFGFSLLDPIAALIVGLMVTKMGIKFFWTALRDLMDHAISEEEIEGIRQTILASDGVLGLHDLRTRRVGDFSLVDVHLEVKRDKSVVEGHDIAFNVREQVMRKHKVLNVMTHVDPV